jgi:hypothetical protein
LRYSANIALAAGLAGLGAFGVMRLFQKFDGFGGLVGSLTAVTVTFMVSATVYFVICYLSGVDELRQLLKLFSRKSDSSQASPTGKTYQR